jgi:hypothetical protein
MIFLFAAIYCTPVERDGFIVTLHPTLVYSLGGLDLWRMPQKCGEAQFNDLGCRGSTGRGRCEMFLSGRV